MSLVVLFVVGVGWCVLVPDIFVVVLFIPLCQLFSVCLWLVSSVCFVWASMLPWYSSAYASFVDFLDVDFQHSDILVGVYCFVYSSLPGNFRMPLVHIMSISYECLVSWVFLYLCFLYWFPWCQLFYTLVIVFLVDCI